MVSLFIVCRYGALCFVHTHGLPVLLLLVVVWDPPDPFATASRLLKRPLGFKVFRKRKGESVCVFSTLYCSLDFLGRSLKAERYFCCLRMPFFVVVVSVQAPVFNSLKAYQTLPRTNGVAGSIYASAHKSASEATPINRRWRTSTGLPANNNRWFRGASGGFSPLPFAGMDIPLSGILFSSKS